MRLSLTLATLGFALTTTGLASAQPAGGPPMQSMPPGAQQGPTPAQMAKFKEFQAVKQKLDGIRDEAMKSDKLQKKEEALKARIDKAMAKVDPEAEKKMDRFEALQKQFEAARAKQDVATAKKLAGELQPLLQSLEASRKKVMSDDKITDAIAAFREAVMTKMKKVDPETPKLLAKAEQLSRELQSSMRGPAGPG